MLLDYTTLLEYKNIAQDLYKYIQHYCIAIYLGGSHCQKYIKHPHDVDLICFAKTPYDMNFIRMGISLYQRKHNIDKLIDLIQIRNEENEEHDYGSYIHKDMILLVGKEINFNFDPINKDRQEYINILLKTIDKLNSGKMINQKR